MFLLNTLTVPKIKDLVNKPNQQYRDIYATLEGGVVSGATTTTNTPLNINTTNSSSDGIADELSSFLNELKKTSPSKKNNEFDTFVNTNDIGYSLY
jgi:hypothetical protein